MCVYICIYICKHIHKCIICLCRLIISYICPKALIQQSSLAEGGGESRSPVLCVYASWQFANHHFKLEKKTCCNMDRNITTKAFSPGYKAPLCYAIWQHLHVVSWLLGAAAGETFPFGIVSICFMQNWLDPKRLLNTYSFGCPTVHIKKLALLLQWQ